MTCKTCKAEIDELAVFPGGICLACHEIKFNREVAENGGTLPRPDFTKVVNPNAGIVPAYPKGRW